MHSNIPHSKTLILYPRVTKAKNMTTKASVLLLSFLTLLSMSKAQDRAPHGLTFKNPMAVSPSAFDFFHPNTQQPSTKNPCSTSNCSPLPVSATVQSTLAHESESKQETRGSQVGANGIAAIVFGFVFAVLSIMVVCYIVVTRRANLSRSNSVQPDDA